MLITQAKPNPIGKDRLGNVIPQAQLAGEWVDFKNTGDESFSLNGVELQHIAYSYLYPNGVWKSVMGFQGTLKAGEIVRVHSGGKIPVIQLYPEDRNGADHHLFTVKNYVWNNDRSDTPRLKNIHANVTVDDATYGASPPEGRILRRSGNYLV